MGRERPPRALAPRRGTLPAPRGAPRARATEGHAPSSQGRPRPLAPRRDAHPGSSSQGRPCPPAPRRGTLPAPRDAHARSRPGGARSRVRPPRFAHARPRPVVRTPRTHFYYGTIRYSRRGVWGAIRVRKPRGSDAAWLCATPRSSRSRREGEPR